MEDKSKITIYMGYLEVFVGVGLIVGPSLGTILYDFGGFTLNYWFISATYLLEFVLNFFFLKAADHKPVDDPQQAECNHVELGESLIHSSMPVAKYSYLSILKDKLSLLALGALAMAILQWSYFDPVLTDRFKQLGLTEQSAGVAFLGLSVFYALSCAANSKFEVIFGNKMCLQIGIIGLGLSSFVAGSNLFLPTEATWPIYLGLAMTGFFQGFTIIPLMGELESIHSSPSRNEEDLIDDCSALCSAFYSLGDCTGPLIGNAMYISYGF